MAVYSDLDFDKLYNEDEIDDDLDCWVVVEAFKKMNSVSKPSIRSFNNVINIDIPNLIMNQPPIILYEDQENNSIQQMIAEYSGQVMKNVQVCHVIDMIESYVDMPRLVDKMTPLTPTEAKIRGMDYSASLHALFRVERVEKNLDTGQIGVEREYQRLLIGSLPIMIGSDHCWTTRSDRLDNEPSKIRVCPYSEGGSFIIKGKEKVIIAQENTRSNKIHVYSDGKNTCRILAEIRSCKEVIRHIVAPLKHFKIYMNIEYSKSGEYILLPQAGQILHFETSGLDPSKSSRMPIIVLLKALGMTNPNDVIRHVLKDRHVNGSDLDVLDAKSAMLFILMHSIHESQNIETQEDALYIIGKMIPEQPIFSSYHHRQQQQNKNCENNNNNNDDEHDEESNRLMVIERAKKMIARELFPHISFGYVPEDENLSIEKAIFICVMIRKLMFVFTGMVEQDDRDYGGNKRYEGVGDLYMKLFGPNLKSMRNEVTKSISDKLNHGNGVDISKSVKTRTITRGMHTPIANGNWPSHSHHKRVGKPKVGMTHELNQISRIATLSHYQRITTSSTEKNTKMTKNRQLHPSLYQKQCPSETPEGDKCGVVNNLAMAGTMSEGSDPKELIEALLILKERKYDQQNRSLYTISLEQYIEEHGSTTLGHGYGINRNDNNTNNNSYPLEWPTIFINGRIYGYAESAIAIVESIREMRREGQFHHEASIHQVVHICKQFTEVHISTECGRLVHPMLTTKAVDQNETRLLNQFLKKMSQEQEQEQEQENTITTMKTELQLRKKHLYQLEQSGITQYGFTDLLREGLVEILDCDEEGSYTLSCVRPSDLGVNGEPYRLAMRPYSHCLVHPSLILGTCAAINPLIEHNPSPRLTYQSSMGKQPFGIQSLNVNQRMDAQSFLLQYPQAPLISTRVSEMVHCDRLPSGQNVIVLVQSCGYNQEDAVIVNQGSIDRGIFRSFSFRSYGCEEKIEHNGSPERFEKIRYGHQHGSYDFLEDDGIVSPGSRMKSGDIIVGKTKKIKPSSNNNNSSGNNRRHSSSRQKSGDARYRPLVFSTTTTSADGGSRRGFGRRFGFANLSSDGRSSGKSPNLRTKNVYRTTANLEQESTSGDVEQNLHPFRVPIIQQRTEFSPSLPINQLGSRLFDDYGNGGKVDNDDDNDVEKEEIKDKSLTLKKNDNNIIIDTVMLTTTSKSRSSVSSANTLARHCVVKTRSQHIPEIGDKFSSRHGQKGTIGMIYLEKDIPYTSDGIRPDLIINSNSQISRMTIADLLEKMLSKYTAMRGEKMFATAFDELRVEELADRLHECGFQKYGEERLYCGKTGKMFEGTMHIGPTYYQRLKHLAREKIAARERGRIHPITRQPVEGRLRKGGLKVGEMERDCLVAHACSENMREVAGRSDLIEALICQGCGTVTHRNFEIDEEKFAVDQFTSNACTQCQNPSQPMTRIQIPYATLLFSQEMACTGIDMQFIAK